MTILVIFFTSLLRPFFPFLELVLYTQKYLDEAKSKNGMLFEQHIHIT